MENFKFLKMSKSRFLFIAIIILLQSCVVPVKRDYQGLSRSLPFNQDKKWLINNMFSSFGSEQREKNNKKIFETFNELSNGKATSMDDARKQNLLASKVSFSPSLEELESLQNNSDFDYLVNSYTEKVHDQISSLELNSPLQYSKNEAFAIIEIYDLKTLKRIYFQKASSETSLDRKKIYPEYSGEELYSDKAKGKSDGPHFSFSANQLAQKNLNKILKDIKKNAIQ